MLEILKDLPAGIDGLKAVGRVSAKDYQEVFEPLLAQARREGRRIRFLYQFGLEFQGLAPGAVWEDAKVGFRFLRLFDGCAVVTDHASIRGASQLVGITLPCPVKVFANEDLAKAAEWLQSLPASPAVLHHLLPDLGVLVVEVERALRAQDFDALALTVDPWVEAHGDLHGVVIHARKFPGWENFGGFFRHVQFVRRHERKVKRIALVMDGELASLGPSIGEHFVHAELKGFAYAELAAAITWAAGSVSNKAAARARP
jgi:hypothetical protein